MASSRVRAEVTRSRDFRGFAELIHAHWVILDNAKGKREGWLYECLTANILAAFKMEAYFNHVGSLLFSDWEQTERKLSKRRKLNKILSKLGIVKADHDPRYTTLNTVFELRDAVAHARTELLSEESSVEEGHVEDLRRRRPMTKWEQLSTIEFATQAFQDTQSVIEEIHAAAKFDPRDLLRSGHSYSLRVLEELGETCIRMPNNQAINPSAEEEGEERRDQQSSQQHASQSSV